MTSVRIAIAVAALSVGLAAQGPKPAPPAAKPAAPASKAAAPLQGTWIITSINGKPSAEGAQELTLTFAGDKYSQAVASTVNERGTITIDATKKPMTIDLGITEGSDAGKTQLGIFEVKGDALRASFDHPGAAKRPTSFETKEGELAIVGKRKKT
jgi:uncharacterized protein (TIGR03067 family)